MSSDFCLLVATISYVFLAWKLHRQSSNIERISVWFATILHVFIAWKLDCQSSHMESMLVWFAAIVYAFDAWKLGVQSSHIKRLEKGKKELQCKLDNAKQENKRLCELRQELEDANKHLEITTAQQEDVIDNLTNSKATITREKKELQCKLDNAKGENKRLCEHRQELEDANEQLEITRSQQEDAIVNLNNSIVTLTTENERLQSELDNTEPLRKRCQQLEYLNKYLSTKRVDQKDKIENLTMSVNTLLREKKQLQFELDNVTQERTQACVENVTLKGQLKKEHTGLWLWRNDQLQWQIFEDSTAFLLEKAYVERTGVIKRHSHGKHWYKYDVRVATDMKQKNVVTQTVRKIKREKMQVSDYPPLWERQSTEILLATVTVFDEYNEVEQLFNKTMAGCCQIQKIERIQSCHLWREYQLSKERMERKNNGQVNEQLLFHSTSTTNPSQIYNSDNGFDVQYAHRGLWGKAIYFAENASYSDKYYPYATGPPGNCRQMFVAKVLTGICYNDAPRDRNRTKCEFPMVDGIPTGPYTFDSLSGMTCGSRVYAIFDNLHSYPNYLITYSLV